MKDKGERSTDECHRVYCSGLAGKHNLGFGLIASSTITNSVMGYKAVEVVSSTSV